MKNRLVVACVIFYQCYLTQSFEDDISPASQSSNIPLKLTTNPASDVSPYVENSQALRAVQEISHYSKRSILDALDLPTFGQFSSYTGDEEKRYKPPSDLSLLAAGIIRANGYPLSVHEVVTEDGYVLTLHRITGPNKNRQLVNQSSESVLLMHGFASSSTDFIIGGPDTGLGFRLADAGYDVWLGNTRGNTYSRKHNRYDPDKEERFWRFSLDEIARYDLPAMVDFILSTTGHSKISYIGHSTGATLFSMASFLMPDFSTKIKFFAAMAPVGFGKKSTGPSRVLTNLAKIGYKYESAKGEILARKEKSFDVIWFFCNGRSVFWKLCLTFITNVAGKNSGLFRRDLLPYIIANFPAGTSIRAAAHLGQILNTDGVQMFDFGRRNNLKVYKQEKSLQYDLSRINCATAVYWAQNDLVAPPEDVQYFKNELSNVVVNFEVGHETFNHYDFVYSNQARHLVHTHLIKAMKKWLKVPF